MLPCMSRYTRKPYVCDYVILLRPPAAASASALIRIGFLILHYIHFHNNENDANIFHSNTWFFLYNFFLYHVMQCPYGTYINVYYESIQILYKKSAVNYNFILFKNNSSKRYIKKVIVSCWAQLIWPTRCQ